MCDPRQTRQMLPVDAGKIVSIFCDDFQTVISGSRHEMTFKHIRNLAYRLFEGFKHFVRLALQSDFDKHRRRMGQFPCIQQRHIFADYADCLKTLNAAVAGAGR